ncbi:MAG TPA: MarR family transcriptional regulator [Gemmatimonadaceae bacterium]|nr:MarR family transcriptional regulator [Gemmatimonadaceae bacterium]
MNRPAGKADPVLFSLLEAAHALEQRLESALSDVGLSMAKYGVVSQLASAKEPLALSELAARQSCVRSNMTQLIDRLEADGLVRRVDDPSDRRSVRAAITRLGEEKAAAGARAMKRVEDDFAASIPPRHRDVLGRLLAGVK